MATCSVCNNKLPREAWSRKQWQRATADGASSSEGQQLTCLTCSREADLCREREVAEARRQQKRGAEGGDRVKKKRPKLHTGDGEIHRTVATVTAMAAAANSTAAAPAKNATIRASWSAVNSSIHTTSSMHTTSSAI